MNFTKSSYGEMLLNNRLLAIIFLFLITVGMSYGAKNLYFDNDYRAFFGKTNPHVISAHLKCMKPTITFDVDNM